MSFPFTLAPVKSLSTGTVFALTAAILLFLLLPPLGVSSAAAASSLYNEGFQEEAEQFPNKEALQAAIADLQKDLQTNSKDVYGQIKLGALQSRLALMEGGDKTLPLLGEALASLEKARTMAGNSRDSIQESLLIELAITRALFAAYGPDGEAKAAFGQAFTDFLLSDEKKILRSVDWYTPNAGWILTLFYEAGNPNISAPAKEKMLIEGARLCFSDAAAKTQISGQSVYLAYIMTFGGMQATGKDSARLLEGALERLNTAEAAMRAEQEKDPDAYRRGDSLFPDLLTLRALINMDLGLAKQGDAGKAMLVSANEALRPGVSRGSYFSLKEDLQRLLPLLEKRAAGKEDTNALFLADMGLLKIILGGGRYALSKEATADIQGRLSRAVALAPKDELVALSDVLIRTNIGDSYRDVKPEDLQALDRAACLATTDATAWNLWEKSLDQRRYTYSDEERAQGYTYAVYTTRQLQALTDMEAEKTCPAFLAYAQGRYQIQNPERNRERNKTERLDQPSVDLLRKAAELAHPAGADALIYYHLGTLYTAAQNITYASDAKLVSPEQRLEYQKVALESFRKSLEAAQKQPLLSGDDYGYSGRSGNEDYCKMVTRLMENPLQSLDEPLLAEGRACFQTPDRYRDEDSPALPWARALTRMAAESLDEYERSEGAQTKAKALLDMALVSFQTLQSAEQPPQAPGNNEQPQTSDAVKQPLSTGVSRSINSDWAESLMDRAKLEAQGSRLPLLQSAQEKLEKNIQEKESGDVYIKLVYCRLLLIPEVPEEERPALFERAYAEFCLAAGMPQNISRARQHWSNILTDQAKDMAEPAKTLFLQEAVRYSLQ